MPLDATNLEKMARTENGLFEAILSRMSEADRQAFDEPRLDALKVACAKLRCVKPPVDIRVSIPLLMARYFFVLQAGRERRHVERRRAERAHRPFWRWGNVIFVASCLLALLYVIVFAEAMLVRGLITEAAPD